MTNAQRVRPRVVVTGIGAVSPLGLSVQELWDGLLAGRSGIRRVTAFDPSGFPSQIAGEVPDFEPSKYMDPKEARRMARASQLALAASQEALSDAGLLSHVKNGSVDAERMGVLIGIGMCGLEKAQDNIDVLRSRGLRAVNPFALAASLPNMPAHHVSIFTGSKGPIGALVAACASGTQSIGEASEHIRRGAADIMISGGVESLIRDYAFAGFCAMRALSLRNDPPERAMCPFDSKRDGFVLSEGAGVVILERLEHAQARGARIYAEVLGHASSSDSYHVAAPDPDGEGAMRAMRWALADANVGPGDIDYINAHGSSTPIGDATETRAIKALFGKAAYDVAISSTKSMIGHSMGGSGALESIACIQTLYTGKIHPTINYEDPDPACDLDYVPNEARQARVEITLKNSFGLGGQNACLVLGKV